MVYRDHSEFRVFYKEGGHLLNYRADISSYPEFRFKL